MFWFEIVQYCTEGIKEGIFEILIFGSFMGFLSLIFGRFCPLGPKIKLKIPINGPKIKNSKIPSLMPSVLCIWRYLPNLGSIGPSRSSENGSPWEKKQKYEHFLQYGISYTFRDIARIPLRVIGDKKWTARS